MVEQKKHKKMKNNYRVKITKKWRYFNDLDKAIRYMSYHCTKSGKKDFAGRIEEWHGEWWSFVIPF